MGSNKFEAQINKNKICNFLDLYQNKKLSKIEQKLFKGIFEKKISESEEFSNGNEESYQENFKTKNEYSISKNTTTRREIFNNENLNCESNMCGRGELDSRSNINDIFEHDYNYRINTSSFNQVKSMDRRKVFKRYVQEDVGLQAVDFEDSKESQESGIKEQDFKFNQREIETGRSKRNDGSPER